MNLAFVSADWGRVPPGAKPPPGGAGWVRIHQPAQALDHHGGHRTVIGASLAAHRTDGYILPLDHGGKPMMMNPEIVVIQRWMNENAAVDIRAARKAGQVVIQDVDDWFWGLHPGNRAYYTTSKRNSAEHNREHYKAAIEASDLVTCSTEFLARRVRERMGTKTVLLRNCVDPNLFATQPVRDVTAGLRVGWTGALMWRSGDLETMRRVLPEWLTRTGSDFVHHGTFPGEPPDHAAALIGIAPDNVGPSRPAVPPDDYPDNVAGFDIGIVPLNDVAFNHAKSWIKGLEYAAAGIPFIAFRTREYEALGAGLLASGPDEWVQQLDRLRDPELRAEQQQIGLTVAAEWSIHKRWQAWESTYLDTLD